VPDNPAQEPAETAAQPARLRISLHSEMAEPTVRIDLGNRSIFNQTFRGKRTRFLRKAEPFSEERTIELDAGLHDLQVIVAPGGKVKGRTVRRSGNFPGGETRTLDILISKDGEVSVNLN
jgi:hypothetical protein